MKYFLGFFFSVTIYLLGGKPVQAQEDWRNFPLDSIYRLADIDTDASEFKNAKAKLGFLLKQPNLPEDLLWKAHSLMGYTCYYLGEYLESNSHYEQALGRHKAVGDSARVINTLRGIGMNFKNLGFFGVYPSYVPNSKKA